MASAGLGSVVNSGAVRILLFLVIILNGAAAMAANFGPEIVISVHDQQMAVLENGRATDKFTISTSRFGIGDQPNSYRTPIGMLWVYEKIGGNPCGRGDQAAGLDWRGDPANRGGATRL